jgi:hypothetical protein
MTNTPVKRITSAAKMNNPKRAILFIAFTFSAELVAFIHPWPYSRA